MLSINTTGKAECSLWITQHYIRFLRNLATKSVKSLQDAQAQAAPETSQARKSFQREEARQTANFSINIEDKDAKCLLG